VIPKDDWSKSMLARKMLWIAGRLQIPALTNPRADHHLELSELIDEVDEAERMAEHFGDIQASAALIGITEHFHNARNGIEVCCGGDDGEDPADFFNFAHEKARDLFHLDCTKAAYRLLAEDSVKPSAGGAAARRGYTVSYMQDELTVSGKTLNKYAKAAGAPIAKRGGKDHEWTADERHKILQYAAEHAGDKHTRRRAKLALGNQN
jgi:hypothetical protein